MNERNGTQWDAKYGPSCGRKKEYKKYVAEINILVTSLVDKINIITKREQK